MEKASKICLFAMDERSHVKNECVIHSSLSKLLEFSSFILYNAYKYGPDQYSFHGILDILK